MLKIFTVFWVILILSTCAPDGEINEDFDYLDEENDCVVLDNFYHIISRETENACAPESGIEIFGGHFWMTVVTQGHTEEGEPIVDIRFATLSWENVKVMSDDTFSAESNFENFEIDYIDGILAPDLIEATFTAELVNFCHLSYEVEGYAMFETIDPPEGWCDE